MQGTSQAGKRRRRLLRGCAIGCGTLLVAALTIELAVRWTVGWTVAYHAPAVPKVTRPTEVQHLNYELEPLARDVTEYPAIPGWPGFKIEYAINADGFRDEDFPREKPPGRVRIAVLGDSFTFGMGVSAGDTYPKVLQRELRVLLGDERIEVLNCGVYGYNTRQEIALLNSRVFEWQPDLVLVCFYMNDVVPLDLRRVGRAWEAELAEKLGLTRGEPRGLISRAQRVQWSLRRTFASLDQLAARAEVVLNQRAHWRILRENWGVEKAFGWGEVVAYLEPLPELARVRGAEARLLLFPDLSVLGNDYPWSEQHAKLAEFCARVGLPFHDLLPAVVEQPTHELIVHQVDNHPNAHCHELVGRWLAEELVETVRALPR